MFQNIRNKIIFGSFFIVGILFYFLVLPFNIIQGIDRFNYFAFLWILLTSMIFFIWFGIKLIKSAFEKKESRKEAMIKCIIIFAIMSICGLNLFLVHQSELTGRKTMFSSLLEGNIDNLSPRGYFEIITTSLDAINVRLSIYDFSNMSRIISLFISAIMFIILSRYINKYISAILTLFISFNNKFIYASTSYEISIISSALFMCLAILFFDMYLKSRQDVKNNGLFLIATLLSTLISTYFKVEMIFFFATPLIIYFLFEKTIKKKKNNEMPNKIIHIAFIILCSLLLILFTYQSFTVSKEYSESGSTGIRNIFTIAGTAFGVFMPKLLRHYMIVKLLFIIAALVFASILIIKLCKTRKEKDKEPLFYLTIIILFTLFLYLFSYFVFMPEYIPEHYVIFPLILLGISCAFTAKIFLKRDMFVAYAVISAIVLYGLWNSYIDPRDNIYSDYDDIMKIGKDLDEHCTLIKFMDERYPYFDFIIDKELKDITYKKLFGDGTFDNGNNSNGFLKGKCYYVFITDYSELIKHDDLVPELTYQIKVLEHFVNMNCTIKKKYSLIFERKDARLFELRC